MNEIGICSIAPYEKHWERSYGRYRIQPGTVEKVSYLWVGDAEDSLCTDFETIPRHYVKVPVLAKDIVADLVGTDERKQGFFLIEGDRPTDEELAVAVEAQRNWHLYQVQIGDTSWQQHHKHEHISDAMRRAAKALGVEREWAGIIKPKVDCPACGELVPAHVALCKFCNVVINREAFEKLEFATQGARPAAYEDLSKGAEQPQAPPPTKTEPVSEGKEA